MDTNTRVFALVQTICFSLLMLHLPSFTEGSLLFANLTGEGVVGYPRPVPESYKGTAEFTFTDLAANRLSRIDFVLTQSGLDQILNVWLMMPVDPINGDLIIDFTQSVNLTTLLQNGSFAGSYLSDQNYTKGIRQEPQNFYVNIKTAKYAAGAIRGSLVDLLPTETTGLVANAEVQINMTAEEVVPKAVPGGGSGMASIAFYYLNNGSLLMEFDFMDTNVTGDMSSIGFYAGEYGLAGDRLWDLTPAMDLLAFQHNGFTGGTMLVDAGVVFKMLNDVSLVYCQISSRSFPAGAIRGQMSLVYVTLPPPPGTPTPRAGIAYNTTPPAPTSGGVSWKLHSGSQWKILLCGFMGIIALVFA